MNLRLPLFFLLAGLSMAGIAQNGPKELGLARITPNAVQAQLDFLASDWTEGRETGTRGEYMASDYIASIFKSLGLKPGGDPIGSASRSRGQRSAQAPAGNQPNRTYFQNINFIETSPGPDQHCALVFTDGKSRQQFDLPYQVDYNVNPGSFSVEFEAPVVFIGYGIKMDELGYDDIGKIDLKGKVVVRLAGFPGWQDINSPAYARFTKDGKNLVIESAKEQLVTEKGALAVIEIRNGSAGLNPSPSNVPYRFNTATYEGDTPQNTGPRKRLSLPGSARAFLPRITLSQRVANSLITRMKLDIARFEKEAATGNKVKTPATEGNISLNLKSSVTTRIIQGRNVIGILEGEDDNNRIVLGAHYDHMGISNGFIFNGADDNASGTVGVMTIARAMTGTGIKPKNTVIFCAWTAEEKGLLGSEFFVSKAETGKIRCYMNYDMISRTALDDSTGMKADYNYSSGVPLLKDLADQHIKQYGLKLDLAYQTSERPTGGSDFTSFSEVGIPIFLIHGKFTPDYHQFTDHSEKAVIPYMTDIIKLGYLNIYELANYKW